MRGVLIALGVVALVATGGYPLRAAVRCHSGQATATQAASAGKVAGRFDPLMSGVCRFSCAEKAKYDPARLVAQPGASEKPGVLTQCPVSGVVFHVDDRRPRALSGDDEYVFCCDKCALKFAERPARYLRESPIRS